MKVLHVLDHSLPVQDGYAYRSREIVRATRALGVETEHLTSAKHGGDGALSEEAEGLTYLRTPVPAGALYRLPLMDQWGVVTSLRARLREVVADCRPDLLHVHSPALNGLASISVARRARVPVLYEMRSLWEDAAVDNGACTEGDLRYRATRAMETWVARRADRLVCICAGLRDDMGARGIEGRPAEVIPNAVDLDRFTGAPPRDETLAAGYGLTPGKTLGFIGSFFRFEGLRVLVEAMPRVLELDPGVRLLLVGGGPEDARLRALADSLGLAGSVTFTGRVPHAEVERYYSVVDAFVYPRLSMRITELVTPLKPLEAMAMEKLVIASDVGGHRELIEAERTGVLFRPEDPRDLAERAVALLADGARQDAMRRAARAYVESERRWSVNGERYAGLYGEMVGEMAA